MAARNLRIVGFRFQILKIPQNQPAGWHTVVYFPAKMVRMLGRAAICAVHYGTPLPIMLQALLQAYRIASSLLQSKHDAASKSPRPDASTHDT
eukprot:scaffold62915_cov55-Attheya_sp.AAC.1